MTMTPFLSPELTGDIAAELGHDGVVIPGPLADEHLKVFAWDAGLTCDRLDAFAFQAAEESAHEGGEVAALFGAAKQGEVSLEERRQMGTAVADIVSGDGRVGQELERFRMGE